MNLDERSSLLLREIIYNPQLKNKDLEEKYGLSRMQISYSFSKINDWLLLNDLPAIKRSKAGFLIVNPEVFSFLKDENQKEKALPNYILTEKERAQLINLFILGKEEVLSLIHFSSALKVSKNTALNDLKIAQELIKPYELKIVYSRQNGYEINGIEFHKRRLLLDTIQTILGMYNGETLIYELISITKEEIQYLHGQLEKIERELNLTFTDEKMNQLPYILAVLIRRIKQGETIESTFYIHYEELSDTKEYQAVELLLSEIKEIPREERLFITLKLLASNISSYDMLTGKIAPELMHALKKMLLLFERNACIALRDKDNLIRLLFIHVKPAYYRIKYHLIVSNPYVEKVDKTFGELHYLVKRSIKPLRDLIGHPIPESEIVYLTMFIGGWLERQGDSIHYKTKALVVCPNGLSVSKLMNNTLQKLFPEFIFLDSLSIREFQQFELDFDIVFSPIILNTNKRLFIVKQLPTEEERLQLRKRVMQELYGYMPSMLSVDEIFRIVSKYSDVKNENKLKKELHSLLEVRQELPHIPNIKKQERLDLADFITAETITIETSVSDWKEAIRIAAKPLLTNESIKQQYIDTIISNYNYDEPYIILGSHVAIPHASPENGVNKTAMSLLSLKEGVYFSERIKVNLIVIIAARDKEHHLRALLQLSELAMSKNDMQKVVNAESKQEIVSIIRNYSEKDM